MEDHLDILAIDIGGTNSRFAWFQAERDRLDLRHKVRLETGRASSLAGLLAALKETDFGLDPESGPVTVAAVAGAVRREVYADPPNIPWAIDLEHDVPDWLTRAALINDFVAQAYGCLTPAAESARQVKPGRPEPEETLGVIGAGTGLGHGALVSLPGGGRTALPSEGGHAAYPFFGQEETEYRDFLLARTGRPYVVGDMVVSGPGLSHLHAFLAQKELSPAEISRGLVPESETCRWFARFYGRAARNWTLCCACLAGLYVTGGVAAKTPMLVDHEAFKAEFTDSPGQREMLEDIPVLLNTEEDIGLWGAAWYGLGLARGRRPG